MMLRILLPDWRENPIVLSVLLAYLSSLQRAKLVYAQILSVHPHCRLLKVTFQKFFYHPTRLSPLQPPS